MCGSSESISLGSRSRVSDPHADRRALAHRYRVARDGARRADRGRLPSATDTAGICPSPRTGANGAGGHSHDLRPHGGVRPAPASAIQRAAHGVLPRPGQDHPHPARGSGRAFLPTWELTMTDTDRIARLERARPLSELWEEIPPEAPVAEVLLPSVPAHVAPEAPEAHDGPHGGPRPW